MKCYNVTCVDAAGNIHTKGVMTSSIDRAKLVAEKSFLEGQHLVVNAISADEVDGI